MKGLRVHDSNVWSIVCQTEVRPIALAWALGVASSKLRACGTESTNSLMNGMCQRLFHIVYVVGLRHWMNVVPSWQLRMSPLALSNLKSIMLSAPMRVVEGCGDEFLCVAYLGSFDYDRKGKTLCTTCEFGRDCVVWPVQIVIFAWKKTPLRGKPMVKRISLLAKKATLINAKQVYSEACICHHFVCFVSERLYPFFFYFGLHHLTIQQRDISFVAIEQGNSINFQASQGKFAKPNYFL